MHFLCAQWNVLNFFNYRCIALYRINIHFPRRASFIQGACGCIEISVAAQFHGCHFSRSLRSLPLDHLQKRHSIDNTNTCNTKLVFVVFVSAGAIGYQKGPIRSKHFWPSMHWLQHSKLKNTDMYRELYREVWNDKTGMHLTWARFTEPLPDRPAAKKVNWSFFSSANFIFSVKTDKCTKPPERTSSMRRCSQMTSNSILSRGRLLALISLSPKLIQYFPF